MSSTEPRQLASQIRGSTAKNRSADIANEREETEAERTKKRTKFIVYANIKIKTNLF